MIYLSSLFFMGCLLPPTESRPRYLESVEFRELTDITEAKNLTQSGRLDSGEFLYRKIIKRNPTSLIAKNDLAYILILEDRLDEACHLLESIILKDRRFIPARLNLARIYVLRGDYSSAIIQYDKVQEIFENYSEQELNEIIGEKISPSLISDLNRLKASAYYLSGEYDEAICLSKLAAGSKAIPAESNLHSRLLYSLEKIREGLEVTRATILSNPENLPNSIAFDYALGLVDGTDYDNAKLVLDQVLKNGNLNNRELGAARLLRFKVEESDSDSLILKQNFLETNKKDCEITTFDVDEYWPYNTLQLILKAQKELCLVDGD